MKAPVFIIHKKNGNNVSFIVKYKPGLNRCTTCIAQSIDWLKSKLGSKYDFYMKYGADNCPLDTPIEPK